MEAKPRDRESYFAQLARKHVFGFIVLLLLMFVALAFEARSPILLRWDTAVTHEIQERPTTPLDFLAYFVTTFGNTVTMILICIVAAFVLRRTGRPMAARFTLLTLLGLPLNLLLKVIVHRPRPTADLVRILFVDAGPSFPSGHAMGSVIVYGFLAYLCWIFIQDPVRRCFWTAVLAIMPIGISLSRIYIGVHWFSDVVGAWMFGLVVLLIFVDLYNLMGSKERRADNQAPPENQGLPSGMASQP